TGYVTAVAFSRDSKRLITSSSDQIVRIWNLNQIDEPLLLRGHTAAVSSVQLPAAITSAVADPSIFKFAVTTGLDGSVRVWDIVAGTSVMVLQGPPGFVGAAFGSDGKTIATTGERGLIQVFECEACQSRSGLLDLAKSRLTKSCPEQ